ncbi:MAG: DUF445 family protein [bacterium]|nr:DUF445 family protein [bacterium]
MGALTAASFLLEGAHPAFRVLTPVLLCGFIGGFTNTVAIRMLFERYRFLPGSGVILKRRREIIHSLAASVEKYIINPEMLEARLREAIRRVDADRVRDALNALLDEFREDLVSYAVSDAVREKIRRALGERLGLLGRIAHWTGIRDLDEAAGELQASVAEQLDGFKVDDAMVEAVLERTGTIEVFLFGRSHPVVRRHYGAEESLAQLLLDRFDVKAAVVERLSQYPPEKIRDIVEENIRRHLAWLEVFGVILGMAFSGLYFIAR